MLKASRVLRVWACIAIAITLLIFFLRQMGYHKMLLTPEVYGYIDLKNSGHTKECISVSMTCEGEDVGAIVIDDDGRFYAPPIRESSFYGLGDKVSISRIKVRICDGNTVNYEMVLEGGDFSSDRIPKAYLFQLYFSDSGNPILRAMEFHGDTRDRIGESEFQKYLEKLSDIREFAKYTKWRFTEIIGRTIHSPPKHEATLRSVPFVPPTGTTCYPRMALYAFNEGASSLERTMAITCHPRMALYTLR
ncbi:MAG: hypothetical protein ACK6A7_09545 [Planctomycetota bacterium]